MYCFFNTSLWIKENQLYDNVSYKQHDLAMEQSMFEKKIKEPGT